MDHRVALKSNTSLRLCNERGEAIHCVIEKEIGRGGSCIVYEASRDTETGDRTLYRVKEFYPYKLNISRDENDCLIPAASDIELFRQQQARLYSDFSRTNQLFYSGNNYSSMTNQLDVFKQNGTLYILSAYSSKQTLASYAPESLKECVMLVKQVAYVLGNIHEQGYLYLDTKPENVLVVDGLQRQVQLFDFDSLLSMRDLRKVSSLNCYDIRLSFSKGFAPIELQTSKVKRLGPSSDVFGVGALLFYLLFSRTPNALECETDAEFDFTKIQYDYQRCDDKLFKKVTEFFHNTLAVYYADRYQSMQEAFEQLKEIEKYADTNTPRIFSTQFAKPKFLFGRERELDEFDRLLTDGKSNCIFLTGMGGIGKSSFIREYLFSHRKEYDTVLYVQYKGSVAATISSDDNVEINTLRQDEEAKSATRYFDKKVQKIREIIRGTSAVLVIDNFTGNVDEDLRAILGTELKVILLSRQSHYYQNSQDFKLSAVSDQIALRQIFEANLGRLLNCDEELGFYQILQRIDRHTLLLELIAKQIANSHITISSAASLAKEHGFSSIAPEKVDYEKDSGSSRDTIGNIIDALFKASELSENKKALIKVASLLGDDGIDINQFQQIMKLDSKDVLNELIRDGWLMISGDVISMHHVIQEAVHRWEWIPGYIDASELFLGYFYVEIVLESTKNNYPKKLREYMTACRAELPTELKDKWIIRKLLSRRDHKMVRVNQWLEKIWDLHGLSGRVNRERYVRAMDDSPADIAKLSSLLLQAEDILGQCKREQVIKANDVYVNLLYVTVLNTPQYKEDYILAETSNIFSSEECDFVMNGAAELFDEGESRNPNTIMRLYAMAVYIHAENHRLEEADSLLAQAERLADRVNRRSVYALYYDLLSGYYDILLNGAYYPETHHEELLLDELCKSIDKTIKFSKKGASLDGNHLYATSTLSKANILVRSCKGSHEKISSLINIAKRIIAENTSPYADVRLQYYLVCGWYYALIHESTESTDVCVQKAKELSEKISPTDLRRIEDVIIPCANMFFELKCHGKSMKLLYEGIQLCAKHANTDSYARIKQELCDHLLQVGIEAEAFDLCQKFILLIDYENAEIVESKNKVIVPSEIRNMIADETN